MPRKVKKRRDKNRCGLSNIASPLGHNTQDTKEEDKTWDEKDDDDDFEFVSRGEVESNNSREKKKSSDEGDSTVITDGIDYPLDIWFLISEKIKPEDVGRFAAICQATCHVVSTARFWFSLYRRHYSWTAALPVNLSIYFMDNIRGLKCAVVRSLFYTYSPFCDRISKEEPLSGHPTKLIGAQCVSQWHLREGNKHKYYFMFAKHLRKKVRKHDSQKLPDVSTDSLIYFNPHDGCYLLETSCKEVCHVPTVMGNHLHNGHLGLSSNLCSHRLQLTLGPAYLLPRKNAERRRRHQLPTTEMLEVMIEPVWDVRIYPWWHPKYWKCMPDHSSSPAEDL